MIQIIGLLIAGYIFVRLLEICSKPSEHFYSHGLHVIVVIISIIGMFCTIGMAIELLLGSASRTPVP